MTFRLGTVCEDCKAEIVRLVEKRCRELKADAGVWPGQGREGYGSVMPCAIGTAWRRRRWRPTTCCTGAEEYRGLADRLARETDPNRNGG